MQTAGGDEDKFPRQCKKGRFSLCTAKILKLARRLIYGVSECVDGNGKLLTHHTITYIRSNRKLTGARRAAILARWPRARSGGSVDPGGRRYLQHSRCDCCSEVTLRFGVFKTLPVGARPRAPGIKVFSQRPLTRSLRVAIAWDGRVRCAP